MKNGELTKDRGGRFCISCNREHGFLYACPEYDQELQKEIERDGEKFRQQCFHGDVLITINGVTKSWKTWCEDKFK